MLRIREDLLGGGGLNDVTGVHNLHAVGHTGHHTHGVGDHHHTGTGFALEVAHQVQNLGLNGHVQSSCRLIGDEKLRVTRERHSDHHSLTHTTRELVRVLIHASFCIRNTNHLQQLDSACLGLFLIHAHVEDERFADLAVDRQHRVQRGHWILEDHCDFVTADPSNLLIGHLQNIFALKDHFAVNDFAWRAWHQSHQ